MRIMFMGTPEFAEVSLKSMVEDNRDVVCVITQPDKPKGRGYEMAMPEVKVYALEKNIPVYQPETLRDEAILPLLEEYKPDVIIVVAYGKILPEYILNFPKYGCINIHGSLLPEYRGAAPIQRAVIDGKKVSGVTSMYMEKGLDTGDMLIKKELPIGEETTAGEYHDALAILGGKVLLETLDALEQGTLSPKKQDDSLSTYASQLSKAEGEIDWNSTNEQIYNKVRGLNPWPKAFSFISGKRFVVDFVYKSTQSGNPGEVISADNDGILVACGDGSVLIKEIKIEGKKKMSVEDYLRGHKIEKGTKLG
ncbi:MAG: methionyl-tRNA formyltransferase [Ruminococcaceae bacterium]|nr:methionyl-tRNA formyltransferase [Oscillospiraceae bacterium]